MVGLYFSAHWCPPCRGFTPQLVAQYGKLQAAGLPFEIVFVSSDRDEKAFEEYYGSMPWLALPYADRERKEELSNRFGVSGIPTLVLLDQERRVITTEGRGAVMGEPSDFPFCPKPVTDLAVSSEGLNEGVCVIVLAEGATAEAAAEAEKAMTPLAEEMAAKAEEAKVRFFLARGGGPAPVIRSKCSLPAVVTAHEHPLAEAAAETGWYCDGCREAKPPRFRCAEGCDFDYCAECNAKASQERTAEKPVVVVLDIPDNGGFYLPACELTTAGLRSMLEDFGAKKLTRQQLS